MPNPWLLRLLLPGAALAPLASLVGPQPPQAPRDTLVIAFQADADTLIDVVSQSASDGEIIANLNYPLVDSDFDCAIEARPALAERWEWSADGAVLTMELRDDITWTDGRPVTAADVAFAMELAADPAVASPYASTLEHLDPGARPKVLGPTRLEWRFTRAYDRITQLAHTSMLHPLPRHVLGSADRSTLRGAPFNAAPVTSGRWKLASWQRGDRIVLEPSERWTGPKEETPKLKRVVFRVLPSYASRLVQLETGGVDLMQSIQVSDADRLAREHPEIKLYRRGWRSMDYVAWNQIDPGTIGEKYSDPPRPHPIFADRAVRRALARAIDVDGLIRELLTSEVTGGSYGRPAVGTITPALCAVHNDDIARIPYDLAAARAELSAAGWEDTDGDGWLDKGGRTFRFTLMTNSGNPRRANASILIQAALRRIGVDAQLETVESNTFFERLRKKDYEAALSGWSAGLFVDPSNIWHSDPEHEFNFVSYRNPKVDELIEKGLRTPDPAASAPIWKEMQRLIYDDQPYAFLYWMDEIVGVHERFQGVKVDVGGAFRDLHAWWVPADKVKYRQ